jgi:hypothetical protein
MRHTRLFHREETTKATMGEGTDFVHQRHRLAEAGEKSNGNSSRRRRRTEGRSWQPHAAFIYGSYPTLVSRLKPTFIGRYESTHAWW